MSGGSKQEQLEHRLDHKLNASSDGIDMDVPAKVISSETVYTGRIFHVDDMRIALTDKQGKEHEIGRQVLRHAPCVVMLVHDMFHPTVTSSNANTVPDRTCSPTGFRRSHGRGRGHHGRGPEGTGRGNRRGAGP